MPQGTRVRESRWTTRRLWWRVGTFAAALGGGLLFLTSYVTAGGNEIRATSVTDLASLVQRQRAETDATVAKAQALTQDVRRLTKLQGGLPTGLQQDLDLLRPKAGLAEVTGPGVTVVLTDAPQSQVNEAMQNGTPPIDLLVVHQQDIQAVVNALWSGGAQAISVQNQRVISTTGIKCVGNTVILHGVPYSPPYRISAVGDPIALQNALDQSDYLAAYRQTADSYGLGYAVTSATELKIPAFEGILKLRHATAVETKKSRSR